MIMDLEKILKDCPELHMRKMRDFRIDECRPIKFATEKPERAEKFKEHMKRIRKHLRC